MTVPQRPDEPQPSRSRFERAYLQERLQMLEAAATALEEQAAAAAPGDASLLADRAVKRRKQADHIRAHLRTFEADG